jgi:hypothetical protein
VASDEGAKVMALEHFTVALSIFEINDLSQNQKLILCMVLSFKDGLINSNEEIGRWTNTKAEVVSAMISDMNSKGYITIKKGRSKYRRILGNPEHPYFKEILKVESGLLSDFSDSTLRFNWDYFKENLKQKANRTKKKEGFAPESYPYDPTEDEVDAVLRGTSL